MKKYDDYWTCPKCSGRNHFSSDSCYSSPGCRADEWERQARYYERKAAELRERAKQERIEQAAESDRAALFVAPPSEG